MKQNNHQAAGFTIIEVLVVIVIAGLILSMVFIAVPQLRRNQRNYARKQDVRSLMVAVKQCINSNQTITRCSRTSDIRLNPETDFAIFEDFALKTSGDSVSSLYSALDIKNNTGPRSINNVWQNMPVIWTRQKCTDVSDGACTRKEDSTNPNDFLICYPIERNANLFTANLWGICVNELFN